MRTFTAIFCLLLAATTFAVTPDPDRPLAVAATMPVEPALVRAGEGPGPTFDANVVSLLDGQVPRERNAVVLPALPGTAVPASFEVRVQVCMEPGGEGLGIVLLDAAKADPDPAKAVEGIIDWDEPNVPNAIGIGLDARNPPSRAGDASDGDGNVYDRPQREASVHVDGREILNRQSDDFATGQPVPIVVSVRFVPGGAMFGLRVEGRPTPIYSDVLLPGVTAFSPRVAIGARSGEGRAKLDVRELELVRGPNLSEPFAAARRVTLFDRVPISLETSRQPIISPELGDVARGAARVIATLTLDAPEVAADRLDRRGAFYCHAADGQVYELFRFRTPFGKPWRWSVDVTDYLPLFRDESQFGLFIDTWQGGFLGTLTLDFYPGDLDRRPIAVTNLWQGEPILGDPWRPANATFATRVVTVPPGVSDAVVRVVATGHGRAPNDLNAAEFLPVRRGLTVNGQRFEDTLWKTDNYLNPCRPQRGKWATDRAGWGPGSIVKPWRVDVGPLLGEGVDRRLTLDYAILGVDPLLGQGNAPLEPYVNNHVGKGDPPTHWIDAQLIFYADVTPTTAPAATATTDAAASTSTSNATSPAAAPSTDAAASTNADAFMSPTSSRADVSGGSVPARSSPRTVPASP